MHKALPLLALALSGCAYDGGPEPAARAQAEMAELADALQGRLAGPPQACVNQRNLGGNRSIGEGVILFGGRSSNLVYVNRPPAGCPEIRPGRALLVRTTGSQLCRGEIVEVIDLASGGPSYGGCGLGDFVPYRRLR